MRRLRTLALVVLACGAFSALGYGAALTRAASGHSDPRPPDGPVTARVELRRIQSSVIARGDAGFSDPAKVAIAPSAPVPVITGTPVAEGGVVHAGDVLLEVAGRPVLLLPGRLPAYRDLAEGDTGPDVAQLEQALASLGYDPGEVDDEYTRSTGAAVAALYDDRGYRPPVAAEEPDPAGTGQGPPAPNGPNVPEPAAVTPLPMGEVAYVSSLPRRVDRLPGQVGATLSDHRVLLSGTTLVVTVGLTTADFGVVDEGMKAVVDLPSGGHVAGRLAEVHPTATGGTATVRLPPLSDKGFRSLKDANVRVTVPLQASDGKVLVVPAAALSTDARGVVRVVRVDRDGSQHPVRVDLGLSADGYAEVQPHDGELEVGDQVVVGR